MSAGNGVATRPEEEVVTGLLSVTVGGKVKPLRVLTMRESRIWKLRLVEVLGSDIGSVQLEGASDLGTLASTAIDRIVALVVEYDVDGSLGGREWLEEHATDQEVYAVLRRCLAVSFPFVQDLRTALAELRALGLADLLARASARGEPDVPSPSESSTNGDSTDGASGSTGALLTSS